jgi:hypothetical protein
MGNKITRTPHKDTPTAIRSNTSSVESTIKRATYLLSKIRHDEAKPYEYTDLKELLLDNQAVSSKDMKARMLALGMESLEEFYIKRKTLKNNDIIKAELMGYLSGLIDVMTDHLTSILAEADQHPESDVSSTGSSSHAGITYSIYAFKDQTFI